jgi:very-short-patch-repair endonuclease
MIRGTDDADEVIMSLAERQYGVVSRAQLLHAGIGSDQVAGRVRRRRLRPLQRGVYLVGPLLVPRARFMSAALCCGESARVSHGSAAMLWQTAESGAGATTVDVTIPPHDRRRRPGVRIHRIELRPDEVTTLDVIPVTSPARTLYDLAGTLAGRDLERVTAEALAQRVTERADIERLVTRYRHRPAAGRLMAILGMDPPPALTRSDAEEELLALIRKAQLPRPAMNVRVQGCEVDLYWRAERLVVEMDGFAFHGWRHRFESDRRRDAVLAAAGLRVMRVTWRQLENEPEGILVRLTQALMRTS